MKSTSSYQLPIDHLEPVDGWGGSIRSAGYVFRPSTREQILNVFDVARSSHRSIVFRGNGCSYGDAAINTEEIVMDLTRMNRILDWNPETGIVTVEPGVTIQQLWEYILSDGWWIPVVPGTMFPTIGGCAAMNIHGKNNFNAGPIGEHILRFELLTPTGQIFECSPEENADVFFAAIGGLGMLGCFTSLTLQMKKIYSGMLEVEPMSANSLEQMFTLFHKHLANSDYLVGWIDAFATGEQLGRGVIHRARYLKQGEDHSPTQSLRVENQQLPDTIMGVFPKSLLWRLMRPMMNNVGMRFTNAAKYRSSELLDRGKTYRQSHAAFAFLLDYIPDWKRSYGEGGLIQYQSFIPEERAYQVFREQLQCAQSFQLQPYLAVFKRHRPDNFLLRHSVDGYSLALDFKITATNRNRVWELTHLLDAIVLNAGGRFYFAKDSTLQPQSVRQFLGEKSLSDFNQLKKRLDPECLLQSDLWRRVFEKQ